MGRAEAGELLDLHKHQFDLIDVGHAATGLRSARCRKARNLPDSGGGSRRSPWLAASRLSCSRNMKGVDGSRAIKNRGILRGNRLVLRERYR